MTSEPCRIDIDGVDRSSWEELVSTFDDASISQTWAMGMASGVRAVSHVVARSEGRVVGCCQVRLRPLFRSGIVIADIVWGPLCEPKGGSFDPDVLLCLLRALKDEYAVRRRCLIKIRPHVTGPKQDLMRQALDEEGFTSDKRCVPYRTLKLDLEAPPQELREGFLQKWRNGLNKAEKSGLRVVEGASDQLFGVLCNLAKEMTERKAFTGVDYDVYRKVQAELPEPLKMRVFVCELAGEPVCAAVCSAIGNTGKYLLGATGTKGLASNGSYLLQWRMIQWMKSIGIRFYDLGGIDPDLNPGVYHFKLGVAGKRGWEERFLGEYNGCFALRGAFAKLAIDLRRLGSSRASN